MRILVTGATGFIGRRLCQVLSQSGHDLVALSRNPDSARKRVPELAQAFAWNPTSDLRSLESLEGVDSVVHLAGEAVTGRWTARKREAIRASRVKGTRNLVEALSQSDSRPRSIVAASAIGYYGDRGDVELREDSASGDDFLADVCQAWEGESLRAEDLGIRVVQLRIGIVLGSGGGAMQAMLLPARLGLGGPLGSGRQWWSWIHLEDLVGAVRQCVEDEELQGPVNATAPNPSRQKDFAKALGRVLSRPAFLPAPAFMLKIALGGFAAELLSSKRVLPGRLRQAGFVFRLPELGSALEAVVQERKFDG